MLIIICGLPGVGKSTAGKLLRTKLKKVELETDKLKPINVLEDLKFKKEVKTSVYNTLFENGVKRLATGGSVILNATFFKKAYRDQAEELAKKFGTKLYIIDVKCPEEIALKRIKKRYESGESDVTAKVYYIIKNQFEPIKRQRFEIDNAESLKNLEKQIDIIIKKIK